MSGIATKQRGSEADYEAIEIAVMETHRGRWFLSEYARRNRQADTEMLLSALSRIERSVARQGETPDVDKLRLDIMEMSQAIARTHAEIAAIKPDDARAGPINEASGELDSIVFETETATSDILAAAESVQEAAWTLREAQADAAICDRLDARATEIYTACSFQDLTSQRIRKVIEGLGFLERRVAAMMEIWGLQENCDPPSADSAARAGREHSMSQADVDHVLVGAQSEPVVGVDDILFTAPEPEPPPLATVPLLMVAAMQDEQPPRPITQQAAPEFAAPEAAALPVPSPTALALAPAAAAEAFQKARAGVELSADEAAQALDALRGMSIEDRTRLFS